MDKIFPQLTLGLSLKDEATFENFYLGMNIEVVDLLKKSVMQQGEKIIFLYGVSGQGRSHLLQAACHYAHTQQLSSVYLPLSHLIKGKPFGFEDQLGRDVTPELLNGLESLSVICFDDVEVIAGLPEWEEAIFHLYNRIYDHGGTIIMAANESPKSIPFQLADLSSRLSWGIVYKLKPLSDDEKLEALLMRAKLRGIPVSEDVGRYVLTHCPRQMHLLFSALNDLDYASLSFKRRITIPFVKEILKIS